VFNQGRKRRPLRWKTNVDNARGRWRLEYPLPRSAAANRCRRAFAHAPQTSTWPRATICRRRGCMGEFETPFPGEGTRPAARATFWSRARLHPSKFYALGREPAAVSSSCFMGGRLRLAIFRSVRCFRDEDLRIDRPAPSSRKSTSSSALSTRTDLFQLVEGPGIYDLERAGALGNRSARVLSGTGHFPRLPLRRFDARLTGNDKTGSALRPAACRHHRAREIEHDGGRHPVSGSRSPEKIQGAAPIGRDVADGDRQGPWVVPASAPLFAHRSRGSSSSWPRAMGAGGLRARPRCRAGRAVGAISARQEA